MNNTRIRSFRRLLHLAAPGGLALLLLPGCSTPAPHAPVRAGTLSTYHNLEKVDDSTSRYVNTQRLASYNRFIVHPVKVVVTRFQGEAISDEARRAASDHFRQAVVHALADRYPVVTEASVDTAELRITVSDAYKEGIQLGLSVEGEILDSYSGVQVAAVVKSALGAAYAGEWWNKVSAREIMDAWAARLRQVLDEAHASR